MCLFPVAVCVRELVDRTVSLHAAGVSAHLFPAPGILFLPSLPQHPSKVTLDLSHPLPDLFKSSHADRKSVV